MRKKEIIAKLDDVEDRIHRLEEIVDRIVRNAADKESVDLIIEYLGVDLRYTPSKRELVKVNRVKNEKN